MKNILETKTFSKGQLLKIIKEFDKENFGNPFKFDFERVAFEASAADELEQQVQDWAEGLDPEEDWGFCIEFDGPGAYAVTTPQDGAYDFRRRVIPAKEVIEWLAMTMVGDDVKKFEDYILCMRFSRMHDWRMKYDGLYAYDYILNNGKAVYLGCYDYPNGSIHAVKFDGKYYKLIHDGTGNQFFHSRKPIEISEEEYEELLQEA